MPLGKNRTAPVRNNLRSCRSRCQLLEKLSVKLVQPQRSKFRRALSQPKKQCFLVSTSRRNRLQFGGNLREQFGQSIISHMSSCKEVDATHPLINIPSMPINLGYLTVPNVVSIAPSSVAIITPRSAVVNRIRKSS